MYNYFCEHNHFFTLLNLGGGFLLNKLFQNLVYQVEEIIQSEFGITDETGEILACSDDSKKGQNIPLINDFLKSGKTSDELEGFSIEKVYIKGKLEFIIFLQTDGNDSSKFLSLISISIKNIKTNYDERFDRNKFLKGLLMESINSEEIPLRAKELHLALNSLRIVFLIRTNESREIFAHEVIQSMFPNRTKDLVIVLDDENTVLVKELKTGSGSKEIGKIACSILDTLTTELMVKTFIGIGNIVENLMEIGQSYKEAEIALTVGKIFEIDKSIVSYDSLGIGRLIYQLPLESCKLFIQEIFKGDTLETIDNETSLTIAKFFENNLNISEASRQLYVHRNTLVYRLDKIQKTTGLDLRRFDDAIKFKMAILVNRYLQGSNE